MGSRGDPRAGRLWLPLPSLRRLAGPGPLGKRLQVPGREFSNPADDGPPFSRVDSVNARNSLATSKSVPWALPGHVALAERRPLATPDGPLSAACEQGWLGLLVSLLILQTAALFAPGAAFLAFLCFPWRGHHFRWPSRMVLLGARRLPVSRREDAGVR